MSVPIDPVFYSEDNRVCIGHNGRVPDHRLAIQNIRYTEIREDECVQNILELIKLLAYIVGYVHKQLGFVRHLLGKIVHLNLRVT